MRRIVLAVVVVTASAGAGNENLLVRTKVPDLLPDPSFPEVARDMAPGAGIFEYAPGESLALGMLWPVLAVDYQSRIQVAGGGGDAIAT